MKWKRLTVTAAGVLAAFTPAIMGTASAAPVTPAAPVSPVSPAASQQARVTLQPYVVEWSRLAGQLGNAAADLGTAAAAAPVSARVYLAGQNPSGLATYAAAVSDPRNPLFHQYLTPAAEQARFGATTSQVSAVRSWLAASGLQITAVTDQYVAVAGTAAQAQQAFGVAWHSYQVDGTTQQAPPPTAQLSAPAPAAAAVLTVAPVQTGLPGSQPGTAAAATPAGHQARAARPAGFRAPAARPAGSGAHAVSRAGSAAASPPCSSYFGQNLATSLPSAYGKTVPYFVCGYTPAQLRSGYGVPGSLTGKGVTVAVVDPWRQQTAAQDLATFGARHGEPLRSGQFTQILPAGLDASCEGTTQGPVTLAVEETQDVEAIHSMAPAANIVYVGAKCDNGIGSVEDLDALSTIVDQRLATIVSNSWNVSRDDALSPGQIGAYEQVFQQGAAEGIGFYFASGDFGEFSFGGPGPGGAPTLPYPQSDPWVTSVGGTSLAIGPAGKYEWEAAWGNDAAGLSADGKSWADLPGDFSGGSGGGTSTLFRQPAYQNGVVPAALGSAGGNGTAMRVVPDIAADADPFTNPLFGETLSPGAGQPAQFVELPEGGTSIATPLIAGMQADAQQAAGGVPIGFANPSIYARTGSQAYHDVSGTPLGAGVTPAVAVPVDPIAFPNITQPLLITLGNDEGLTATPGYDDATGVGTPASGYFASYQH